MTDTKTVITGLECIAQRAQNGTCGPCSYFRPFTDDPDCGWCDKVAIANDAITLLREQETGHWIFLTDGPNSGIYCSVCNTKVFDSYPFKKKLSYFCPHCSTRMEGEVERR